MRKSLLVVLDFCTMLLSRVFYGANKSLVKKYVYFFSYTHVGSYGSGVGRTEVTVFKPIISIADIKSLEEKIVKETEVGQGQKMENVATTNFMLLRTEE